MIAFQLADFIARCIAIFLPKRWKTRIYYNVSDLEVYVLRKSETRTKPRMTFVESFGATILFDLVSHCLPSLISISHRG